MREALWLDIEPRNYHYAITAAALVQSFMIAFVGRLSGLRAVLARCGHRVNTQHIGPLSTAVHRSSTLRFVQRLVGWLESTHKPGDEELVGLDGMALTLPKTQRHRCKKFNNKTVGGGVVWAYMVHAVKGVCPVHVLKVVEGAWHDTKVMRTVSLIPHGPVYLMDRGFYALDLLHQWLNERVRFIVRVRKRSLMYDGLERLSPPCRVGNKTVLLDARVRLGSPRAKRRPVVRLIRAVLPCGEQLILATDRFDWTTVRILDAYQKRWHIERFHRFLKDTLGLAHLYSFHQTGITFLLYTALLVALLLFLAAADPRGEIIAVLRQMLRLVRRALGLETPWKRNTFSPRRTKRKTTSNTEKTVER